MARLFGAPGPGGGEEVTVDEFVQTCFGMGDPFGPVEEGETVYYTNEADGKIGIFIYNTIYEFSAEEFEEMKAKMPKVKFELEPPEGLDGFTKESLMQIEYERTGFREQVKIGQHGQACPYCGENHVVLPPDSKGVVMRCGKVKKPVAKVMTEESLIERQARSLAYRVLRRVRHEDANDWDNREFEPGGPHEQEEGREVEIGDEIIAIVGVVRDISTPESRNHAYDMIEKLAQELVDMHRAPGASPDDVVSHSAIPKHQPHCGICGSIRHQTVSCPKEGMPI